MSSLWSCRGTEWDSERVRGRQRERETETERTVKLNPNTPSHAIQNTVATGNTFTTHEPRYIPPNVGLHTVDFTDCYKFLWPRSVFFFAHIITAHSNSQFMVKQQQATRFTSISVPYSSCYFYISFINRICHDDVNTLGTYSWSHSQWEMPHEHGQRCRLRLLCQCRRRKGRRIMWIDKHQLHTYQHTTEVCKIYRLDSQRSTELYIFEVQERVVTTVFCCSEEFVT